MSGTRVLTPVSVQISAAASISNWYPTDYRFSINRQQRLFVVATLNAADSIILTATPDYWDSSTGAPTTSPTIVTITATLTAANAVTLVDGPWTAFRVQKIGTTGAATVKAVI